MEFSLQYIFEVVLYTECLAGITANVIIVAANFKKWRTLKSLGPCDRVLNLLAISRILYLLSIFIFFFFSRFYPQFLNFVSFTTIAVAFVLLNSTNLWFATILCLLYCVKITSYNWKLFIFLKTKISTLIPWLILASLVISVSTSLPIGWCVYGIQNLTHGSMDNFTDHSDLFVVNFHNQFIIFLSGSYPPFITFCVPNILLIQSLRNHTRRMRSSGSSPNLKSHFHAVKSMSLFLVLHLVYFVCMNITFMGYLEDHKVLFLLINIIACVSPFFHSLYIICSRSDLQKLLISLLCCLKSV